VLVKRAIFLLNAAFAMAIVDLISQVHLPSFVNMLSKYLKYFTVNTKTLGIQCTYWEYSALIGNTVHLLGIKCTYWQLLL